MGSKLSFSFVVPCLNAEETLKSCLEHLRGQNVSEELLEIIVVDNGSSDLSPQIAKQLADQVLIDPTATIARLRNHGAAKARNDVVVFVDSDCLLAGDWLERCTAYFEDSNVGMVGAKTHTLPDEAGWVAKAWKVHLDRSDLDPNPQWIVTRALAVRRTVFKAVGGFDETLETCEDVALGHAVRGAHRIIADSKLAPVHLEDADSLKQLYEKERWRGRDSILTSLRSIKAQPSSLLGKEGISLALPFYFLLMSLGIAGSILCWATTGQTLPFFVFVLAILTPLFIITLDTCRKTGQLRWFFGVLAVYAAYIAARVSALFSAGTSHRRIVDG